MRIELYEGDCLKVLRQLPSESVDLVVTSPPYNIGIDYGVYKDDLDFDEYFCFMESVIKEIYRVLCVGGRVAWNVLIEVNKPRRYSPLVEFYKIFERAGFGHFGIVLWYDETRTKLSAWGSYKSAQQPYIYTPHEVILLFYKDTPKRIGGISDITDREFMDWVRGTWKVIPEANQLTKCAFPLEIPKRLIKLLSFVGDTVLDPFCGSGTTLLASLMLKRSAIGIEINPEYVSIIKKRLNWGYSLGNIEFLYDKVE